MTILLAGWQVKAQTIVDTVCAGESGKVYWVTGSPGSIFDWNVIGADNILYQNDSIQVDWGIVPGIFPMSVVETSVQGCPGDVVSGNILVLPVPWVYLGADTAVCENTGYILDAGTAGNSYLWQDGSTGQFMPVTSSGLYWVQVSNSVGCSDVDSIMVNVMPLPDINLGQDTTLCNGTPLLLDAGSGLSYYNWSDGSTLQTLLVISSGTYSVTVTDANGCNNADTVNITISPYSSFSAVITNITCNSGNNGTIDLSVTGGTSPFGYNWSTGSTAQDLAGLGEGIYSVTVTDAEGCSTTGNWTVIQSDAIIISSTVINVSCNNLSNGSIDITVTGGSSPYTCLWSNNSTNQDISGLTGGTYVISVTDSHGCLQTDSINVINPAEVSSTIIAANLTCYGSADGQANLTVSGGTSPYLFIWSQGYTTEDLSGIQAGLYFVLIFDSNSCTDNNFINVTQPSDIYTTLTNVNVSCAGNSDGSINLNISGGTPPFSYQWSDNSTTEDIISLAGGQYIVTVTDSHNCLHSDSVTINVPLPLSASLIAVPVQCYGWSNGSINLTPDGGTVPYQYLWSYGQTTEDISGLASATYFVTVTDNNSCSVTDSAQVVQPPSSIDVSSVTAPVVCYGGNNGSVNITVSGGISPYAYIWSDSSTNEDATGLASGIYTVTISDNNLCNLTFSETVSGPLAPVSAYSSVTNVNCNGNSTGAIDILVTGGTSPYSYIWSNAETSEDISSLAAGNYFLTITDQYDCVTTTVFTVIEPNPVTLYFTQVNVNCYGDLTGSANLTVVGGTMPYTYQWSNGVTTQDVFNLQADQYFVTVTDANGCPSSFDSLTITQPSSALSIQMTVTDVSCYSGSDGIIDISVTGGIQPYAFLWSGGEITEDISGIQSGTFSVSVTDYNNCFISGLTQVSQPSAPLNLTFTTGPISCHGDADGYIDLTLTGGTSPYSFIWSDNQTTEDLLNIVAGNYFVTISDLNSCYISQAFTIVQPLLLVIDAQVINIACMSDSTGSINLTVSGGTSPYEFLWSDGITDGDISGLIPGNYSVSVTDGNNCLGTAVYFITSPSSLLTLNIVATNLDCLSDTSGSIDLTVTGGSIPYFYSWSNGSTTQDLTGLQLGSYFVTVTDADLCSVTSGATVGEANHVVIESMSISDFNGFGISCFDGADGYIGLSVNGGNPPYSFIWNNGLINQNLYDIHAGYYQVTVTDLTGCNDIETVVLTQPPSLSITESIIYPTCHDFADGSVSATVTGGLPPYNYNWSNLQVIPSITSIPSGIYTLTVTDANNCFIIDELNLPDLYDECIFIPSAFTPNSDGFNDVWNIRGIELYPKTVIEVYNRWGQLLFRSDIGYHEKWDGKYNGNDLPSDTYHYVVNLEEGLEPIIGTVTIIR